MTETRLAIFAGLSYPLYQWVLLRLAGRKAKMHELLVFFSTLGGILLFGATGFILGPVPAALFITAWEMFGTAFRTKIAGPVTPVPSSFS